MRFGSQEWCIAYHFFFKKCLSLIWFGNRDVYGDIQELLGLFLIRALLFQEATLGQLPADLFEEMVFIIDDLA